MKDSNKEFFPSSWAINNKTSIFVITIIITLAGLLSYFAIPKENFPEIVIPKIFVKTIYPGTSPANMETLVTRQLEKRMKSISGVKKVTSNSYQDFSFITVEFGTDVKIDLAKKKVQDEVDKAKPDLPKNLLTEPEVMDINLSELPIMYVNLSGDIDLYRLKKYADKIKEKIESLKEITRVDIVGALDREIQINVDMYKMEAAKISLGDIERAIGSENLTLSGGTVPMDGVRRSINIRKTFTNTNEISKLIIKSPEGASIYLGNIAEIKDTHKEQESFARLNGKNVITLNIVKRSGENLIEASDKIKEIMAEMQKSEFPDDLKVVITGDQSDRTKSTLHDLINTIIIGFILVTLILMFFMGVTNAIFVAMSVPLSMFLAFMVMPSIGFTMNMIVLFAFLLALGIVVDDAIVVIENTHRIFDNGKVPIKQAAKKAAGEIFMPVLSGTLTTLAPFIPLAFWDGMIGKFMFFLPITLIITLLASLVVAYIINPVFAVHFMKPHRKKDEIQLTINIKTWTKRMKVISIIFIALAFIFYVFGVHGFGNLILTFLVLFLFNRIFLEKYIKNFQNSIWPKFQDSYTRFLKYSLARPYKVLLGTLLLFIFSIGLMYVRSPKIVFFPSGDPNFCYVYLNLPVGTDPSKTNEILLKVEDKVYSVIGKNNPIVTSVISNVTIGVSDPRDEDQGQFPNKGKISISFVGFAQRNGEKTSTYLEKIREAVRDIPGAEITVSPEQAGPPVSKPISIEIKGDNLAQLIKTSEDVKRFLNDLDIAGVEELKSDFQNNKPELVFDIDRERANREGISSAQIGFEIRNAVFGKEISKFRDDEDEYPIQLRYHKNQRDNVEALKNAKITYRDMGMGGIIRQVPISAFTDIRYENTYGGIKRENQERIINLSSDVIESYNPNEVVLKVERALKNFPLKEGVTVRMGGQQEEQKETSAFLGRALMISLGLIFLILVLQFNSISKPLIILTEIIFSVIGVLLGVAIFKMDMSIVMTGIGIVALAGIVVRNGILLVEFTDLLIEQGVDTFEAIVEAGRTRMTPVLLTASATILGLIPLAVGLNIDFVTLFTEFNPHIYFGGDSVRFWGPLSWTMIFGLGFATFLTLILVPVLYLLTEKLKRRRSK